jgi:hypothetical protein
MKKITSLFLLTAIMISILSCGSSDNPIDNSTSSDHNTESELEETTFIISPDLPKKDYQGYEFKLLTTDEIGSLRYSYEIDADTENGEPLNDAVYKRNIYVEDQFNVKITQIAYDKGSFRSAFKNSVLAADDAYDILVDTYDNILPMGRDYGMEISSLPYVDIDKPWWDGSVIRQAAINGKIYGLLGDINVVDNASTWCLLFNKNMAEEFKVGDLYKTVRDGNWTLTELKKNIKGVSSDINGDSIMDINDRWGLITSGNTLVALLWSCGGSIGKLANDGTLDLKIDSERNIDALNAAWELVSDVNNVLDISRTSGDWNKFRSVFIEGRALFIAGVISYVDYFREMKDEFGILPLPKYDENQKEYISTSQEWMATMFMAPVSASDPERTSIILEAMASASVSTITPAYYDTVLKWKRIRDNDSSEMLDIIFASRVFDIVYAYNWGSVRELSKVVVAPSNTIASTIASMKSMIQAAFDAQFKK